MFAGLSTLDTNEEVTGRTYTRVDLKGKLLDLSSCNSLQNGVIW